MPGDTTSLYRDPTPREIHIGLGLALGIALSCTDRQVGGACLPPASADGPVEIEVAVGFPLSWYCADPPPPELLTGAYQSRLIWIEGEDCDPCDRELIASRAMDQVCAEVETSPPIRLLCGPIDYPLDPWDRKGCVYAVADPGSCPIY